MTTVNFKLDIDADGIALVTWDVPGRSMNVIDLKTIEELSTIVEKVAGDAAIKGAVITSGKETFCAGADLTMLEVFSREFSDTVKAQGEEMAVKRLFEESRKLSQLYRRLDRHLSGADRLAHFRRYGSVRATRTGHGRPGNARAIWALSRAVGSRGTHRPARAAGTQASQHSARDADRNLAWL